METDDQDKPACDKETKEPPAPKPADKPTVNGTTSPNRNSPVVNGNPDDTDNQEGPILPDNANVIHLSYILYNQKRMI